MSDALKIVLKAADDKKAHDLVALDISQIASFASYFNYTDYLTRNTLLIKNFFGKPHIIGFAFNLPSG